MTVKRRVAVIVGGTGHIGGAVASELLRADCEVVVVARGLSPIDSSPNSRLTPQNQLMIYKADMTLESDVRDCFESVKSAMGRIDYLIYSAGFAPDADVPLAAYSTTSWLKTLNTYATGFFLCFREGLQVMEKAGHIVAVSSAVTRFRANALPPIYAGHYAAAKAALDELCKWGKREANERGILLSRIAPGAVDSPVHRAAPIHLRPSAMVPVSVVSEKIIAALLSGEEIDEAVVAA